MVAPFAGERRRRHARGAERSVTGGQGDDRGGVLEEAALAIVLGCMIAAKVLSPQFVLWIAPLLALVARGPVGAALALLTAGLTSEIFPGRYDSLMDAAPGDGHAVLALAARNALLIGWYVVAMHRLTKQRTPACRLDGGAGTLPGPLLPTRRSRQGGQAVDAGRAGCQSEAPSGDLNVEVQ